MTRPRALPVLLGCGVASSLLYVANDLVATFRWHDYHFASQSVSELMAIGAPSRPLFVALGLVYDVLLAAFAVAVWHVAAGRRALRVTAASLAVIAAVGVVAAPFAPMHLRGTPGTATDTLHIVLTGVIVVATLVGMVSASTTSLGATFRWYSIVTLAVVLLAGARTGLDGPRLAAGLPTPWMGLFERVNIYGYLLWVVVLALRLRREPVAPRRSDAGTSHSQAAAQELRASGARHA